MGDNGNARSGGRKTIAYVGPFRFPDSSAPSRRIEGVVRSLRVAGHTVLIAPGDPPDDASSGVGRYADLCEVHFCREVPPKTSSNLYKIYRHLTWGGNTLRWLREMTPRPDLVVVYGGFVPYMAKLLPWARDAGVALAVDAVEWYDPSHVAGGALGPLALDSEVAMRWIYPRAGNIIAISRFLQDYYHKKGCCTVRVPPTLDVDGTPARLHINAGRLELAYAGVPGKKDLIENVVGAVLRVDPTGERLRLTIVGPTAEAVLQMNSVRALSKGRLPPCLQAVGRVSHDRAVDIVRRADFMPLLRPPHRYAHAGFPTKVAESLAVGTPVLCNVTGDLGEYVRNGREGLIVCDHTSDAFAQVLERALALSDAERVAMRRAARDAAENCFDYRRYTGALDDFVRQACA